MIEWWLTYSNMIGLLECIILWRVQRVSGISPMPFLWEVSHSLFWPSIYIWCFNNLSLFLEYFSDNWINSQFIYTKFIAFDMFDVIIDVIHSDFLMHKWERMDICNEFSCSFLFCVAAVLCRTRILPMFLIHGNYVHN